MNLPKFHYTIHINWKWVFESAIESLEYQHAEIPSKLPSQTDEPTIKKKKYDYALFRLDFYLEKNDGCPNQIISNWVTSQMFSNLDPKDALYRTLSRMKATHLMPKTILLAYDSIEVSSIPSQMLPSIPTSILKAPLGSGGDSLYFVSSAQAVVDVIVDHKKRAENSYGFLESLIRDYGSVPQWSLQEYVRPIKAFGRRTQFRVYVVFSELSESVFIYNSAEVRLPEWTDDLDAVLLGDMRFDNNNSSSSSSSSSNDNNNNNNSSSNDNNDNSNSSSSGSSGSSGSSRSRPYNENRNKSNTERFLVREVPELVHVESVLIKCVEDAMIHLKPYMQESIGTLCMSTCNRKENSREEEEEEDQEPAAVPPSRRVNKYSIVGIDLIVSSETGECYILEFNYNPAMPAPTKCMSELYRQHLVQFVRSVIDLSYVESTIPATSLMGIDSASSTDSNSKSNCNSRNSNHSRPGTKNILFNIADFDCLMKRFIQIKC